MPPRLDMFKNRQRANSFGSQADAYDAYRPRYPDVMIDDLLAGGARAILDVGAGTGIASQQFRDRGARVLALEPDARMAAVARNKGIEVELGTFEEWPSNGRTFDLVVFAASFHWVDSSVALPKVQDILRPGGRLALMWNRLAPTGELKDELNSIYAGYWDVGTADPNSGSDEVVSALKAAGYDVATHHYPQTRHYSREQWIDFAFTHSNYLTLSTEQATELRARLSDRIGSDGVSVYGNSLSIVATPSAYTQ
jgi:SAM-dependent methyltransferase